MNNTKNKKVSLIKKIVTIVLGVLGIGTITSCYGMPPDEWGENEFTGTVYSESYNEKGELTWFETEDVEVSLMSADMEFLFNVDHTDENGHYCVYTHYQGEDAELVFNPYKSDEARTDDIQLYGEYLETKHIPVKLEHFENDYDVNSKNIDVYLKWVKADPEDETDLP